MKMNMKQSKTNPIYCGSLYGINYPIYDKLFNFDEQGVSLTKTVKRELVKNTIKDLGIAKDSKIKVIDFMTGRGEYLKEVLRVLPNAKLTGVDIAISESPLFSSKKAKFIHADVFEWVHDLANEIRGGKTDKRYDLGIFAWNSLVSFIWDDFKDEGPYFDAEVAMGKIAKLMDDFKVVCKNLVMEFQTGVSLDDTIEEYNFDVPSDLPIVKEFNLNPKGMHFTIEEDFLFHRNAFIWTIKGTDADGKVIVFDPIWRSYLPAPLIYSIIVKRYEIVKLYEWGEGSKPYTPLKDVNHLTPNQDVNLWILKGYE